MTFGINKLIQDLSAIGFDGVTAIKDSGGIDFAIILNFEIPAGKFAGRIIELGIPAPPDYPRSQGASIHIKSCPHLTAFESIPSIRNIQPSNLGSEWQYWSYGFNVRQSDSTNELISKINEIFKNFK